MTWVIMATSSRHTISHETEVVRYFAMYINLYINFLVWVLSFLSLAALAAQNCDGFFYMLVT